MIVRLAKSVVAAVCLIFFLYQVYESYEKLTTHDIITISKTINQEDFQVPGIRFCHETVMSLNITPPRNMSEVYKLKGAFNETILAAYAGYILKDLTFKSVREWNQFDFKHWHEDVYPIIIPNVTDIQPQQVDCYILDSVSLKTQHGLTFGVELIINITRSYKDGFHFIYVSDPGQSIFADKAIFGTDFKTINLKGLNVTDEKSLNVFMFNARSTVRKKLRVEGEFECFADGADTLSSCFLDRFTNFMQCRSPYQKTFHELPICSSEAQLKAVAEFPMKWNYSSKLSFFMNTLKCELPCAYNEYKLSLLSSSSQRCPFTEGCRNVISIQLVSPDSQVEVVTEKWLYDQSNFIADVGGYLGLLLGVSVLTLFDYIHCAIRAIRKFLNKNII